MSTEKKDEKKDGAQEIKEEKTEAQKTEELSDKDLDSVAGGKRTKTDF